MLPLPESFEFTVRPEHADITYCGVPWKCVFANALQENLPADYPLIPSVIGHAVRFVDRQPHGAFAWGASKTDDVIFSDEARHLAYAFDEADQPAKFTAFLASLGDGITFIFDSENKRVYKKEL